MDEGLIDRLRADLAAAGYRTDRIAELLGEAADEARRRGVFAPARRALAGLHAIEQGGTRRNPEPTALTVLVRVFLLGEAVPADALDTALPKLRSEGAAALGLVVQDPDTSDSGSAGAGGSGAYRAALSLNSEVTGAGESRREWWIISDLDDQLRRGPARPDHVMGVGGATRSLIAQAHEPRVVSAGDPGGAGELNCLDLGTGCGIVALHLAAMLREGRIRGRVVATDISERALRMARANARLNGVDGMDGADRSTGADAIDFRLGDLFEPVAGERFELILSNPPFVITPRTDDAPIYEYRDGGQVGDALAERVVREAPARLAEGGVLLCLANWESRGGESGLDRARGWAEGAAESLAGAGGGLSAWLIERDLLTPEQYAETWVRDGGSRPGDTEFERLLGLWLDDFSERSVTNVGLGAVRLRRERAAAIGSEGSAGTVVRAEQAGGPFGPAPGAALQRSFEQGAACARMSDAEVLRTRWVRDPGVSEVREHRPGEDGPRAISLTCEGGVYRRIHADTVLAAAVGACDGELTLGQIADALATLLELDPAEVAEALAAHARELAWLGMLDASAESPPLSAGAD